jgi:CRP-like cAMP-binding protein
MQNINPQEAYAALFRELCRIKRLSYTGWKAFMERTTIVRFRANEVFVKAGTPSTHSYFIIKGLVMSYKGHEPKEINWVRAEHGYVFTVDRFRFGGEPIPNEYSLVALEDTLAFSLSHEDFDWLSEHVRGFDMLNAGLLMKDCMKMKQISNCLITNSRDRYEWIQKVHGFNIDRIPDVYLVHCIGVTLKRLKELQKNNRIDFLTRY